MKALIPLIIDVLLIVILYFPSKKKYEDEIENYSKEEYSLLEFMPMGLKVIDIFGEKRFKSLNQTSLNKLIGLYGLETEKKYRAYFANKIVIGFLFSLIIFAFQVINGKFSLLITILGIVAPIIIYFVLDSKIDDDLKKRSENIKYDFPDFLNKLALLINAGLTFEGAWKQILSRDKRNNILNSELRTTLKDIEANVPRDIALRNFARRCKVNIVTRFTNLVIQNLNKGTSDLTNMLDSLANECWLERQNYAKRKGEEASTKLLFPMMLMLIAVFIITVVPAMLQMIGF
ncbi:MAG: type II secretion system F family protein [Clostridium sp.]|nr:type II secretion system F family protein [Clostridium sp.]